MISFFKAKVLLESFLKILYSFYPCSFSWCSHFLNTNNPCEPDMSELTSIALIDLKNYDNWLQLLTAWPSSIFCTAALLLADRHWNPATVETAMTSGQGITRSRRGHSEWQPKYRMLVCSFLFVVNSKKKCSGTRLLTLKYDDSGIQLGVSWHCDTCLTVTMHSAVVLLYCHFMVLT